MSHTWPNDNWTRVEVYRLVYGHLPTHTSDTITRKTLNQFVGMALKKNNPIRSETIDVLEIVQEILAKRFLVSSALKRKDPTP